MAENTGKPAGSFTQIMRVCVGILLILYIAKIYLRDPDYRHIEVCYLPYKISHVVWVGAWGTLFTNDIATYQKHSSDLSDMYNSCVNSVGKWTWLRSFSNHQ